MKKRCLSGTLVLLLLLLGSSILAQDFSNKGKDFWVGYGYHSVMNAGNSQEMVLYFAADQNTNVTVTMPGLGYSQTFFVSANTVFTTPALPKSGMFDSRLTTPSSVPENKGIHITSDKPIVAYAHIYNASVSGATILFPTNTLGKEYYSINYTNISNAVNANCWFYVVAADPGITTVEITPSAVTADGRAAGVPFTVTLTQGQIFNVMGATNSNRGVDLTGSTIKSISAAGGGCKRIGVFSGSGRIAISCDGSAPSSDNYMVQAFPKTAWGKKYLTTYTGGTSPNNIFRVCVSDPTTVVKINGNPIIYPLLDNFYYEIPVTPRPMLIEGDKAILVAQYLTSQGTCGNTGPGDPEVIYLSPVEQNINKVLWNAPSRSAITQHYYNVIIPNTGTAISSFKLDGNPVPASSFIPHPQSPGYSFLVQPVSLGQHIISSDTGFNAIAYGYGTTESYGYNAGTNIKDIYQYISMANQYATVNFPATCKGTPFHFSMTFPYEPTRIEWQFNGLFGDVIDNAPAYVSTTIVNGRTLYKYELPANPSYSIPTAGVYPIKVIAQNPTPDGCGGEQEIDFDIQVFDPPVANFNFTNTGCITNPVLFTDNSPDNGRPLAYWNWDFGDATTSTVNNPSHTYATGGSFDVKYRVITDVGCISPEVTKKVIITDVPLAKFTAAATQYCVGSTITFTDESTITAPGTLNKWTWDFGDGAPLVVLAPGNQTHAYATAGLYHVTLKVESNTGCVSTLFSQDITIGETPSAVFAMPNVCLPSGSATFTDNSTVTGGGTISSWAWDFGDGGTGNAQNPTHVYTSTGPFNVSLTVTSNSGCINTRTQSFTTVYAEPQAAFAAVPEICLGNTASFNDQSTAAASTVTGWEWDFGDGSPVSNLQNPTHVYATAGTFIVTLNVTSAIGCKTTATHAATRQVVVNRLPQAGFTIGSAACVTRDVLFNDASVANAGNIVKWNWDFGNATTAVYNSGAPFTRVYNSSTTYSVKLFVETDKGCISPVTAKDITIHQLPKAGFIIPEACISDVATAFIDTSKINSGSITGWNWDFGDANAIPANPNTSNQQNGTHHFTVAGNYTTTLVAISNEGCTDTVKHVFFVNGSVPVAGFTVDNQNALCSNKEVSIVDGSTIDIGRLVKTEIYWDYSNDPTIKTIDNDPLAGRQYKHTYPEFSSPASKTVTIQYVTYSGATCLSTSTRTITLLATPAVVFNAVAAVCEDAPAFQVTQAQITNGLAGTPSFTGAGISASGLFNPAQAGVGQHMIQYTFTANNGCSNSIAKVLEVNPKPGINAGPDKYVLQGGVVTLTPSENQGITVTYLWTPATGLNNPTAANPVASPSEDITYTVTVTSGKGCKSSDEVFVKVLKKPLIPNIFSPNGDGIHDRWEVPFLESYPGCTIDIINAYGQRVYHSVGYSKPWDGKVNGKDVPVGTYYYVIDPKNGRERMTGYVDVIR